MSASYCLLKLYHYKSINYKILETLNFVFENFHACVVHELPSPPQAPHPSQAQPLTSPKDRKTLNKAPPSSYQLLEHLIAPLPPIHPFLLFPKHPSTLPSSLQAHMQDQQHSRRRSWSSHFVTSQQSDYKAPNNVNPPPRPNMHLWDSHISFKTDDVSYIIPLLYHSQL